MEHISMFNAEGLGAELIRLRTEAHLSQRDLARLSTVSNTLISTLEVGTAAAPHPEILRKLARGLSTSGLGQLDERRADDRYIALMIAAGYLPASVGGEPTEADLATILPDKFGPQVGGALVRLYRVLTVVETGDTAALTTIVSNTAQKY